MKSTEERSFKQKRSRFSGHAERHFHSYLLGVFVASLIMLLGSFVTGKKNFLNAQTSGSCVPACTITIDATALRGYIAVDGDGNSNALPAETVQSVSLSAGTHTFDYGPNWGVSGYDFTVNADGSLVCPTQSPTENIPGFDCSVPQTLKVTGVPVTLQTSALLPGNWLIFIWGLAGSPNTGTRVMNLPPTVGRNPYQWHFPVGINNNAGIGGNNFPIGLRNDASLNCAAFSGFADCSGSTITINGFPITIDATSFPSSVQLVEDGYSAFTGSQTINLVPNNSTSEYQLYNSATSETTTFSVDTSGHVQVGTANKFIYGTTEYPLATNPACPTILFIGQTAPACPGTSITFSATAGTKTVNVEIHKPTIGTANVSQSQIIDALKEAIVSNLNAYQNNAKVDVNFSGSNLTSVAVTQTSSASALTILEQPSSLSSSNLQEEQWMMVAGALAQPDVVAGNRSVSLSGDTSAQQKLVADFKISGSAIYGQAILDPNFADAFNSSVLTVAAKQVMTGSSIAGAIVSGGSSATRPTERYRMSALNDSAASMSIWSVDFASVSPSQTETVLATASIQNDGTYPAYLEPTLAGTFSAGVTEGNGTQKVVNQITLQQTADGTVTTASWSTAPAAPSL